MQHRLRPQTEFRKLVNECVRRAEELYGVDLGRITVSFDLRGQKAGEAAQRPHEDLGYTYSLRFNREALLRDWEMMTKSILPHEVAHLIAFAKPSLRADGHNAAWKRIAKRLGDSRRGATYHTMTLPPARRLRKFVYRNGTGAEVSIGPALHRSVQQGEKMIVFERQSFHACDFAGTA
jgi:SprT protein